MQRPPRPWQPRGALAQRMNGVPPLGASGECRNHAIGEQIFARAADGRIYQLRPEFDAAGEAEGEAVPALLLVRAADLLVLGVAWSGCAVVPPSEGEGSAALLAGPEASMMITLAPQSTGEMAFDEFLGAAAPARLSGPSRVALALSANTRVPLTVEGILAALADSGQIATHVSALGAPLGDRTAVGVADRAAARGSG